MENRMKVDFICESDEGVRYYSIDGREIGLALDGTLMEGGTNMDCIDNKSIAEREEIKSAIAEMENKEKCKCENCGFEDKLFKVGMHMLCSDCQIEDEAALFEQAIFDSWQD